MRAGCAERGRPTEAIGWKASAGSLNQPLSRRAAGSGHHQRHPGTIRGHHRTPKRTHVIAIISAI